MSASSSVALAREIVTARNRVGARVAVLAAAGADMAEAFTLADAIDDLDRRRDLGEAIEEMHRLDAELAELGAHGATAVALSRALVGL